MFELRGKRLEVSAGRDGEFLRIDLDYDGAGSAHKFQVEGIEASELFPCAASVMARDGLAFERDGLFSLFVNFARNGARFPRQLESIGCTDSVALITIVFHGDGPVEEGGHIRLIDRD